MCGGRPKGRSLRVSDLRAVNARLREVIAGQGTLLAAQDARIDTQARHIRAQGELIDTQAQQFRTQGELVETHAQLETQGELVETLEAQVAELERRLGMDSSNSSTPPSQDRPEAAAKRTRGRRGVSGREQGGQPGHPGRSLQRVAVPDRREVVEPGDCSGCGGALVGAPGEVAGSVQVFDIPPVEVSRASWSGARAPSSAPVTASSTVAARTERQSGVATWSARARAHS